MSRFLVTGGAGFIGSHIVEALVKKKHYVRVLDNFSSGRKENLQGLSGKIDLITGDIRSLSTCVNAARGIDFVLHQAAARSVPKSMKNPREYNEINIGGTLNMLEASCGRGVRCFVFASSSSVYGDVDRFPQREDFLPQPISPYALTKLTGEHYCRMFSFHYGLPTVSLRYFNVFGPRQSLDDEYAVVIPKFINCIMNDEKPPIYGTGKQSRDFTYIDNVVAANIASARALKKGARVFNVGCGRNNDILGLVRILNKIMRKNITPVFLDARPGDVLKTQADIRRIARELGYRPKVDFSKGLELTVKYFKNA
ncbi:MAG: SDR family oxidoreductase [Candidatus Omnitrophota bacterium]|jgi:nucleoside-diphosphate-sugar epimerase